MVSILEVCTFLNGMCLHEFYGYLDCTVVVEIKLQLEIKLQQVPKSSCKIWNKMSMYNLPLLDLQTPLISF